MSPLFFIASLSFGSGSASRFYHHHNVRKTSCQFLCPRPLPRGRPTPLSYFPADAQEGHCRRNLARMTANSGEGTGGNDEKANNTNKQNNIIRNINNDYFLRSKGGERGEGGEEQEGEGESEIHANSTYINDILPLPPRIALTREVGKNDTLLRLLQELYSYAEIMELPCVRTVRLQAGFSQLTKLLKTGIQHSSITWIVVTSPESATTLIDAWRAAHSPTSLHGVKLAVVGKATGDTLKAVGFDIAYTPTKAAGITLAKEFPPLDNVHDHILYPASVKASDDIANTLREVQGFEGVIRVNTYSTEAAEFSQEKRGLCKGVDVVTFAAPSAVKAWCQNVGVGSGVVAACIGETSARAAREAGFARVRHAERPGMEGWLVAIDEGVKIIESEKKEVSEKTRNLM